MLATQIWHNPSPPVTVLVAVLATLVLVGTAGCDSISFLGGEEGSEFTLQVAHESIRSGAVKVEQIDRGQYGDIVEGTRRVLHGGDEYAAFWERLHADRDSTPARPDVDFGSHVVVAIVLGERPSGGYGTTIDDVLASEDGERVQVQYTEVIPGDGCAVTQALTSPYVLVAVAAQEAEFTFSRSEKTRSC